MPSEVARFTVLMPRGHVKLLKRRALEYDTSASDLVRQALEHYYATRFAGGQNPTRAIKRNFS